MASEATADRARPPPPSGCTSPVRRNADSDSPQLLQRPFTASGARATRLVGVLVRWGEHLDRLVQAADAAEDEAAERSPPSTYVALRTSRQADEEHTEERSNSDDPDHHASYVLRSSPFATTRVVERSAHPMWNEQLLVALPAEWRQQQQQAWTVHVDVVRRDPSQQEDTLLATVALPLTTLLRRASHKWRAPRHVAIDLAPQESASTQPAPRVYLSLTDSDGMEDASDVVEVVVEELGGDSVTTSGPAEIEGPAIVVLSSTAVPAKSPRSSVRDLFELVSGAHPSPNGSSSRSTWITPTAKLKRVDNSSPLRRLRWQFPAMFSICRDGGTTSTDTAAASARLDQLHASLYSVVPSGESTYDFQFVGAASLELLTAPTDGTATSMKTALSPHQALEVTVRRWDGPSWMRFQRESVSRRVITTNRRHRKRAALQALEWTGALCRGLNRYPISSFCDDGGLSGLLARYLATASVHDNDGHHANGEPGSADANAAEDALRRPEELLNQHIRLLQHEVMAKQETIQKLQRDAEASVTALRKCGAELVAARKEVRARDDAVAQLQTKLRELEQREADQTQALLAATSGLTGLRLDSHGAQRLNMLIFKYKELEQRHTSCEAELADAKRAIATMEQLERRYSELEQAHVVQAGLVQRLQQDKARHGELQRTIRMQEKVIQKLERAVTLQPQPVPPQLPTLPPTSAAHQTASVEEDTPLLAMRVQVLEQQLQTNAKAAASEIGRLKMRVMELETQLSSNSQSGEYESPARRPGR